MLVVLDVCVQDVFVMGVCRREFKERDLCSGCLQVTNIQQADIVTVIVYHSDFLHVIQDNSHLAYGDSAQRHGGHKHTSQKDIKAIQSLAKRTLITDILHFQLKCSTHGVAAH